MANLLDIQGLRIVTEGPNPKTIVEDIDLQIAPGEVVALIGESGSGKTTIAVASMGYARPGLRIADGSVHLGDTDVRALDRDGLRDLRGRRVSYIAQSAAASFNPGLTIGYQVTEPSRLHGLSSQSAAAASAVKLYEELSLPNPETIGQRYPHQVSGGQLQRLMAAMGMNTGPELLVLDEPTTALDVTTQIAVLMSFKQLLRKKGAAAIYVSHDLSVVAQIADRVLVLLNGKIVETGPIEQIISHPKRNYTRVLMAASDPDLSAEEFENLRPKPAMTDVKPDRESIPTVSLTGVTAGYGAVKSGRPDFPVLEDISIDLEPKEVLGVIGESGSGKSTLAKVIAGYLPAASGSITLNGETLPPDLRNRTRTHLKGVQMVFQMADTALNPKHSVGKILGRPLQVFRDVSRAQRTAKIAEVLEMVGLGPEFAERRPSELSGGQKQRVNLARALVVDPAVLLCDEVTSALDAVVRNNMIRLLSEIRHKTDLSMIFISHDISTIAVLADKVAVMYRGRVVEYGPTREVCENPKTSYARLLMASVPHLRVGWLEEAVAEREAVLARAKDIVLND